MRTRGACVRIGAMAGAATWAFITFPLCKLVQCIFFEASSVRLRENHAACQMPSDIASLIFALTLGMLTMAVALPAVMGQVDEAARRAQRGVAC